MILLRSLLLLTFVFYFSSAQALQCRSFLTKAISVEFHPEKPLRFMSLNTLNLYLHQGKYIWTETGLEKVDQDHLPRQKSELHTEGLAKAIRDTQPDFIMLQEVEGVESLDRFNRRYLDDAYEIFMPRTNDSRGIGIALLVRQGLGVKVKTRKYKENVWVNKKGNEEPILTRGFPVFEVYFGESEEPNIVLAGVHYKSKRDRPNDPDSFFKRSKEVEESVEILNDVKVQFPNSPVVVMGDFNSNPDQKEFSAFFDKLGMIDAHEVDGVFQDPEKMGRSTFVFLPKEGERKEQTFDLALMSPDLAPHLRSSSVYRYKNSISGEIFPLPQNIEDKRKKPSDHYPIIFDLDSDVLYSEYK